MSNHSGTYYRSTTFGCGQPFCRFSARRQAGPFPLPAAAFLVVLALITTACGPARPDQTQSDAAAAQCGDGVAQGWEQCDGYDFREATCEDRGFTGGVLTCRPSCTIGVDQCHGCGNGACEAGENRVTCLADCGPQRVWASFHSCTLLGTGEAYCWGNGSSGALGNGSFERVNPPTAVLGGAVYRSLALGTYHTCGMLQDASVSCWGDGNYIADPEQQDTAVPRPVSSLTSTAALAAEHSGTCALNVQGNLTCWGSAAVTGSSAPDGSILPIPISSIEAVVEQVTCGSGHCLALLEDGTVWGWGYNWNGVLGYDLDEPRLEPIQVNMAHEVQELSTGNYHNCILTTDGQVVCWGANSGGQCGQPASGIPVLPPTAVDLPAQAAKVTAGGFNHTCALGVSGEAWCWGGIRYDEYWGQLGHGLATPSHEPVAVSGLTDVIDISAGEWHTCALTSDRRLWCWGSNFAGEVQASSQEERFLSPVEVVIP